MTTVQTLIVQFGAMGLTGTSGTRCESWRDEPER